MADGADGKVYIHEFIDIIGHNRAKYFQHMTANWSPIGQRERNQLCLACGAPWAAPAVGPRS